MAGKRHMESLKGRVAIVTGASRGIGLGIAAELVRQGAMVCVTARKAEALEGARTMETFGRLDMLVNNAGINPVYGPLIDVDPAAAAKILAVNVLAPLAWTKLARDAWMGEHGGSVVNVSSVAGLRASPGIGT